MQVKGHHAVQVWAKIPKVTLQFGTSIQLVSSSQVNQPLTGAGRCLTSRTAKSGGTLQCQCLIELRTFMKKVRTRQVGWGVNLRTYRFAPVCWRSFNRDLMKHDIPRSDETLPGTTNQAREPT